MIACALPMARNPFPAECSAVCAFPHNAGTQGRDRADPGESRPDSVKPDLCNMQALPSGILKSKTGGNN